MVPNRNDFLGGLFDFNGDGRTDPGEMFIAYKIFEATTKDDLDDEEEDDRGSELSSLY